MPKQPTFPTLYNECKTINIADLKRWGYLNPNQYKTGTITWSRNGNKTASISIDINTNTETPYIELQYNCNGKPINYTVYFVSIPSNIGKGVVWYFLCPVTGKRCRKLYLISSHFYHRTAFKGCMYEKQTYSHKTRQLYNYLDKLNITNKLNSKYFKRYYKGKPTKRYERLFNQIRTVQSISANELLKF